VELPGSRGGKWAARASLSRDFRGSCRTAQNSPPGFCAVGRRRPKCLVGAQDESASKKVIHRRPWVLGLSEGWPCTAGQTSSGTGPFLPRETRPSRYVNVQYSERQSGRPKTKTMLFGFFEARQFAFWAGGERGLLQILATECDKLYGDRPNSLGIRQSPTSCEVPRPPMLSGRFIKHLG